MGKFGLQRNALKTTADPSASLRVGFRLRLPQKRAQTSLRMTELPVETLGIRLLLRVQRVLGFLEELVLQAQAL